MPELELELELELKSKYRNRSALIYRWDMVMMFTCPFNKIIIVLTIEVVYRTQISEGGVAEWLRR